MPNKHPSRRKVLKSLGASTAAIGGASEAGASSDQEVVRPDVTGLEAEEVNGYEWYIGMRQALSDERYDKISSNFQSQGLDPKYRESDVVKVTESDGSHRYVVVTPFQNSNDDGAPDEAYTLYTGTENQSTLTAGGYQVKHSDSGSLALSNNNNNFEELEVYYVDDGPEIQSAEGSGSVGEVKSEAETLDTGTDSPGLLRVPRGPRLDPGGGAGCSTCVRKKADLNSCNVNWSCVLKYSGALVGTMGACAACVLPEPSSVATCPACLGGALTQSGVAISCPGVQNCDTYEECIDPDAETCLCPPYEC